MPASPESVTNKAPHGPESARVIVVSLSWLGDCIMAMPALAALRRRLPGAHITVLAKPSVMELWRLFPGVDEVIPLLKGWKGMRAVMHAVRELDADFAYVLPKSFRAAWIPFLAWVPGRRGMPGHCRDWMLTERADLSSEAVSGHQSLEMADVLHIPHQELGQPPFLVIPSDDRGRMRSKLDSLFGGTSEGFVAFFPGAARGPSKRWPEERFAEVGRRLVQEKRYRILVLGSHGDRPVCERVAVEIGTGAVSLAGETTFVELAAVLTSCRVVVANDSGGMHLAAGLGVPVVGIFGLTDPVKTAPVGREHRLLAAKGVVRSRDIKRESGAALSALRSIPVDEVFQAVLSL